MSKVIYFRSRSSVGEYSCTNGEIDSAANTRLRVIYPTGGSTDPDATGGNGSAEESFDRIIDTTEITDKLNTLSEELQPIVEFSLTPGVVAGWHNHPDNHPSMTVTAPKTQDAEGWATRAAYLLEKFEKETKRQHLFTEPVLALCALRLNDGRHILPSSPVLLLPNTSAPTVEGSDNFALESMTMTIPVKASRLRCRISVAGSFSDWSSRIAHIRQRGGTGQITGISIFLSSPIPLYHHDEGLLPVHRGSAGQSSGAGFPQSWVTSSLTDSEFTSRLLMTTTFRPVSEIPLDSLTTYAREEDNATETTGFFDVEFNIPDFTDDIKGNETVQGISAYIPDFLQHHAVTAMTGCRISGRTTLCDLTFTLAAPPPLATMIQCEEEGSLSSVAQISLSSDIVDEATDVTSVVIGSEIEFHKSCGVLHSSCYSSNEPKVRLTESCFPKWLFIPDPNARQLTLMTSEAIYIVPLKRHPVLNGAYYWCGSTGYKDLISTGVRKLGSTVGRLTVLNDNVAEPETDVMPRVNGITEGGESVKRDSYRLANAVWRSEKDCELLFPDRLLLLPDVGRVIALCRAFRASGLVATTSPTAYLFTTHGIYLLKEMDNGELRDAGLIANYILASAESLKVLGKSIEFTTSSGERMSISGTSVKLLSGNSIEDSDAKFLSRAAIGDSDANITGVSNEGSVSGRTDEAIVGNITGSSTLGTMSKSVLVVIEPENREEKVEIVTRALKLKSLIPSLDSIRKALLSLSSVKDFMAGNGYADCVVGNSSTNFLIGNGYSNFTVGNSYAKGVCNPLPVLSPIERLELAEQIMWNIELEGAFQRIGLELKLYGSDDLVNWRLIAQSDRPYLRGLLTPGLRFGRLVISGYLTGTLEAIRITSR